MDSKAAAGVEALMVWTLLSGRWLCISPGSMWRRCPHVAAGLPAKGRCTCCLGCVCVCVCVCRALGSFQQLLKDKGHCLAHPDVLLSAVGTKVRLLRLLSSTAHATHVTGRCPCSSFMHEGAQAARSTLPCTICAPSGNQCPLQPCWSCSSPWCPP
jgi:hypothetical protein